MTRPEGRDCATKNNTYFIWLYRAFCSVRSCWDCTRLFRYWSISRSKFSMIKVCDVCLFRSSQRSLSSFRSLSSKSIDNWLILFSPSLCPSLIFWKSKETLLRNRNRWNYTTSMKDILGLISMQDCRLNGKCSHRHESIFNGWYKLFSPTKCFPKMPFPSQEPQNPQYSWRTSFISYSAHNLLCKGPFEEYSCICSFLDMRPLGSQKLQRWFEDIFLKFANIFKKKIQTEKKRRKFRNLKRNFKVFEIMCLNSLHLNILQST